MPAKTYIIADQFVVLEYAALTDVMRKKTNGREMIKQEEAVLINHEYQQRTWMEKGFIGQGHALYDYCKRIDITIIFCEDTNNNVE